MKTKIITGLFLLCAGIIHAQTDRDYIAQKLKVYFVPHPNTAPVEIIRIPAARIVDSAFIFGSASENGMDVCALFLKQLFRPVGSGREGMPALQRLAAKTLRITGDSIRLFVFKDDADFNAFARSNYGFGPNDNRVWPVAWRDDVDPDASGSIHRGNIFIGENYPLNNGGITILRRTFLHELLHTQDFSYNRRHHWTLGTTNFNYGSDNIHYYVELVPNFAAAYKEGVANSITYIYSQIEERNVLNWFGENGDCITEHRRPNGMPASQWLYDQISSTTPPGAGRTPTSPAYNSNIVSNYKVYRLSELPSRFIIYNEQIIGIIGTEYAKKIGETKYFAALRHSNAQLFRVSTSAIARFFENLSAEALPDGVTVANATSTSRAEMPYFLPLALADYFTYYRSTTKNEFRAMFENSLDQRWVDAYWDAGRTIVRGAAPIALTGGRPPRLNVRQNIDAIATALGIRTP